MKKWITCFFTVCLLAVALSVTAFAEDGIQTPKVKSEFESTVSVDLKGTDQATVTYSAAVNGKEYLVIVTEGGGTPTEDNIVYIDQKTAGSNGVTFNVYPKLLTNAVYSVRISSNASNGITVLTEVATFENKVSYKLGDVNNDGDINASDATRVLLHAAKKITLVDTQLLAANVTGDLTGAGQPNVNASDATRILLYVAKKITAF